jgi:hypothetical protein
MDSINDATSDSWIQSSSIDFTATEIYENSSQILNLTKDGFQDGEFLSRGPNFLPYISMILYTIVCIIGLFGNSLVI